MSDKRYLGAGIDVLFDGRRCLHAAECVRGLPAVFDTGARPWIQPDAATPAEVAEVVRRCPSGALRIAGDYPAETPEEPTSVTVRPQAPMFLRGDLRIATPDGEILSETRAALCVCGASENRPFCDGSGDCRGWHQPAPRSPR